MERSTPTSAVNDDSCQKPQIAPLNAMEPITTHLSPSLPSVNRFVEEQIAAIPRSISMTTANIPANTAAVVTNLLPTNYEGAWGGMWQSLIAPIKKFWEAPPLHVSTYYGTPNQVGRPGPVVSIMIERAGVLHSRARQRLRRQQQQLQQQKLLSSATSLPSLASLTLGASTSGSATNVSRNSFMTGTASTTYARGNSDTTLDNDDSGATSADIEGVLLVTPRAIERYQLKGTPIKRGALNDTITAFIGAKVAGVGRVLVCGTQSGRVHVLKTNLLDATLVFDTVCLSAKAARCNKKLRHCYATPPVAAVSSSIMTYATTSTTEVPSVFADPPRLLAEAVLMKATPMSNQSVKTSVNDERTVLEAASLSRLGTLTGDGMTPALLEGRTAALKRLQSLKGPSILNLFKLLHQSPNNSLHAFHHLNQDVLSLLQYLAKKTSSRTEICSLATMCSFSNFCEMIIAGTSKGEIFGWSVPSGRLVLAFEYVGETTAGSSEPNPKNDHLNCCVTALQVIELLGIGHRLWSGYETSYLSIFDINAKKQLDSLKIPGGAPVVSMEVATQLEAMLVLSGNMQLTVWSCETPKLLATLSASDLTRGIPISCFKLARSSSRRPLIEPATIMFLGCVDGSLWVHRLSWSESDTPNLSPSIQPNFHLRNRSKLTGFVDDTVAMPCNTIDVSLAHRAHNTLECRLIKSFIREIEPRCPISAMWIDPVVDTVFVGDASGVVATLLPIRHLLHEERHHHKSLIPLSSAERRRLRSRLSSIEFKCSDSASRFDNPQQSHNQSCETIEVEGSNNSSSYVEQHLNFNDDNATEDKSNTVVLNTSTKNVNSLYSQNFNNFSSVST